MNIKEIRFECELFRQKLMQFNKNIMIDFSVFDPEEMAKNIEGENGQSQSK